MPVFAAVSGEQLPEGCRKGLKLQRLHNHQSCQHAPNEQVIAVQVEGINASVDALLALKGALGVPEFQCVFDGGVHFTHFRSAFLAGPDY